MHAKDYRFTTTLFSDSVFTQVFWPHGEVG